MEKLKFKSVLSGNRYSSNLVLPDFERENGKFSRGKTLYKILCEEYGVIDENGVTVETKDVTDIDRDRSRCYSFCDKAKHFAIEFTVKKNGVGSSFVADIFVPTRIDKPNYFVHLDFVEPLPGKYCPVEEILDGGFGLAHVYYNDVTKDDDNFSAGLAPVFCDRGNAYGAGKIAVWAYAAKIVGEYLINNKLATSDKLYVIGHSRLGKTALLAAALYDIFAGCLVNCSGCSGAAISRAIRGETLKDITDRFPYWFTPNFKKYADREDDEEFDQHFLMASVAPRKVYIVAASEDDWADAEAQYLCAEAASAAYRELGLTGLASLEKMPCAGEKNDEGEIKFFHRAGPHFLSREDWGFYMDCIKSEK